jgi:hypothetical protein
MHWQRRHRTLRLRLLKLRVRIDFERVSLVAGSDEQLSLATSYNDIVFGVGITFYAIYHPVLGREDYRSQSVPGTQLLLAQIGNF